LGGRGHPDEAIIRINEAKCRPKRRKKLRTQINGKLIDISSADENKQQEYHCTCIAFISKP
jgi:hypothetical protein